MEERVVYCHFSFRRPKGKPYGIFASAIYSDEEGKQIIAERTLALALWKDHQHVTAIQAYSNALESVWHWQAKLKKYNVGTVMLVTDNSILAGWIINPNKNRQYTAWMKQAVTPYRVGAKKEITLGVGLCDPRDSEKSHKFCREDLICNKRPTEAKYEGSGLNKLELGGSFKTAFDVINEVKPEGLDLMQEV